MALTIHRASHKLKMTPRCMNNNGIAQDPEPYVDFSALLVHKPVGITSHTLTKRVSRCVGALKAGHTGTLDKAASGLMIVLLGKATKLSRFFLSLDKDYRAVFALGAETTTLDSEGQCIKIMPPPSEEAFTKAFHSYKGVIEQRPPLYSALHVDGTRAYQRAKEDPTLTLAPRTVTIYESQIVSFDSTEQRATCTFTVSSGTYIRSIARDVTDACNSCGHLQALLRTRIATISLDEATTLNDIEEGNYTHALFPADTLLRRIQEVDVVHSDAATLRKALVYGISPDIVTTRDESQIPVMLYDNEGFLGMWEFARGAWRVVMHMGS